MKTRTKLAVLVIEVLVLFAMFSAVYFSNTREAFKSTETLYFDRVLPLEYIKSVSDAYAISIVDISVKLEKELIAKDIAISELHQTKGQIDSVWKVYLATYLTDDEVELIKQVEVHRSTADKALNSLFSLLGQTNYLPLLETFNKNRLYPSIEPLTRSLNDLARLQLEVAHSLYQSNMLRFQKMEIISLISVATLLFILALTSYIIITYIDKNINLLTTASKQVAGGDTTARVSIHENRQDELAQLIYVFNDMITNIDTSQQELLSQNEMLQEQAVEIEVMNTSLGESNLNLQATNKKLEELLRQKSVFMSIASHDLKNPLQSILMLTNSLRYYPERMTREKYEEILEKTSRVVEKMNSLIVNFLHLSAAEEGKLTLDIVPLELPSILAPLVDDYKEKALKKAITLQCSSLSEQPILADKAALTQVFDNILSNAIKFSPAQSTVFITSKVVATVDRKCVEISITDQGPGISPQEKQRLFERFSKLSARPTAGESSTGLGLYIAHLLIEAMNGSITCHSELGKGTTFSLFLPCQ